MFRKEFTTNYYIWCYFRRWKENYTFPHILGKVHRREEPFHLYLGDTTQTYTR